MLVVCGNCNGFYVKRYFSRHMKSCMGDIARIPIAIPVSILDKKMDSIDTTFKEDILARFKPSAHYRQKVTLFVVTMTKSSLTTRKLDHKNYIGLDYRRYRRKTTVAA